MHWESISKLIVLLFFSRISRNQATFTLEANTLEQLKENGTSSLIGTQTVGFPSHNPQDIHFYSFPSLRNSTAGDEIILHNLTSLQNSNLKPRKKLVVFIHGFASSYLDHFPDLLLKTYLNTSLEYNYIAVDWSLLAYSPTYLYPAVYADVVKWNIPTVAKRVCDFINFLKVSNYTRLDLIHVIGHSLGAHVSGWAGKLIQDKSASSTVDNCQEEECQETRLLNSSSFNATSSASTKINKIWRISGLDPAGPLFDGIEVQRKLRPDDAVFVDVYHTAIGTRGDSKVSGHVDFYPNGGYVQPPCKVDDYKYPLFLGSCSHKFVSNIYAATIVRNITACPCAVLEGGLVPLPKCTAPSAASVSTTQSCKNMTLVGEPLTNTTRGQFYFEFIPLGILEEFSNETSNFLQGIKDINSDEVL